MEIFLSTKPSFCKAYRKLIYRISYVFVTLMALSCWRVISKSSKIRVTVTPDTTVDED